MGAQTSKDIPSAPSISASLSGKAISILVLTLPQCPTIISSGCVVVVGTSRIRPSRCLDSRVGTYLQAVPDFCIETKTPGQFNHDDDAFKMLFDFFKNLSTL
jgi:hypothetical protein